MRLKEREAPKEGRKMAHEPMGEGMRRERKPDGFYSSMSDAEIIAYARQTIPGKCILTRKELREKDPGLCDALTKRKLLDHVGLDKKARDWAMVGDEELKQLAFRCIAENGITSRTGFRRADSGLYHALKMRDLLHYAGPAREKRRWSALTEDEMIEAAKGAITHLKISGRSELYRADSRLYSVLLRRELLDKVGLDSKRGEMRDWASMDDGTLGSYARAFIEKEGIGGRRELRKADAGLYDALKRRRLLDGVGLQDKQRNWAGMDDEALRAHARTFVSIKGIMRREELRRADSRLYCILRRRDLLDGIGLRNRNENYREWESKSGKELVEIARNAMKKKGIRGRSGLARADSGLYQALRVRKLLDDAFFGIETSKHKDAVRGVVDALESFGDTT